MRRLKSGAMAIAGRLLTSALALFVLAWCMLSPAARANPAPSRRLGITMFVVEPGTLSEGDLKILFTDPTTSRGYVVVFSTNPSDQNGTKFSGTVPSGLLARVDTNEADWTFRVTEAAEILSRQRGVSPLRIEAHPTSLAAPLVAFMDDVQTYQQTDRPWQDSPRTSLPIDIVLVLGQRLHRLDHEAIWDPLCDTLATDAASLAEMRARLKTLQDQAAALRLTLDIRLLIGSSNQTARWTNIDLYNLLSVAGIEPNTSHTVAALFNPACVVGGSSRRPADFGPKRLLDLASMVRIDACAPASSPPRKVPVPELFCAQQSDETINLATLSTSAEQTPPEPQIQPPPKPPERPSPAEQTPPEPQIQPPPKPPERPSPAEQTPPEPRIPPTPKPPERPSPAEQKPPEPPPAPQPPRDAANAAHPGVEWTVAYSAPAAPAAPTNERFLVRVDVRSPPENATLDFVAIPPGSALKPQDASGHPLLGIRPGDRDASGGYAVFVRITPSAPGCREGRPIRVDITMTGTAFASGTPARLSITEKIFTCETIIRRLPGFIIP